ncbi:nucleotide disphospho-sugar-binding domain-containing protein [Kitasatospora sp. DSM 101779]|uniref:nucleotide disphospho-sugar-binding domain-containing protein n=1 Tax=Kitasatospora sp. DSM 101779 TaxID=2853165 RepID=UPI0021D91B0B|nr:glycosyltransferase [Kitasatospora sp. DSM 101779]MCU7826425.1 glycosyltransferase [Kitasatospora sp. DSM 101779]
MVHVVVISPPFASHAAPLAALGAALRDAGARVDLASTAAFAPLAAGAGIGFTELAVARNANHGVAERTRQDPAEAARLREFLTATSRGAVETLLTQAAHRRADLLAEPDRVLADIRALHRRLQPDWYLVDQLAYPATLALHCLGLPYASFCPGHPSYIPAGPDAYFGVPYAWPDTVRPTAEALVRLTRAAADNDRAFTAAFHRVIDRNAPHRPRPDRAFALSSPRAVVHNYPELPWLPAPSTGAAALRCGHCTQPPAPLAEPWTGVADGLTAGGRPLVLLALGTFLSARHDVLATVADGVLRHTSAGLVVAAGDRVGEVSSALAASGAPAERFHVADRIPQQALLTRASAMVHHAGNNSFTECLAAGVPVLALPFSSDQFAIAHDLERADVGLSLDPNALTADTAGRAVERLLTRDRSANDAVRAAVLRRGPDWAAGQLLRLMR